MLFTGRCTKVFRGRNGWGVMHGTDCRWTCRLQGYLTAIPGLLFIWCSAWAVPNLLRRIYGAVTLFSFRFTLYYIYRRFGLARIYWGFSWTPLLCFIFFAQRCGGKRQCLDGNRGIIAMAVYAAVYMGYSISRCCGKARSDA